MYRARKRLSFIARSVSLRCTGSARISRKSFAASRSSRSAAPTEGNATWMFRRACGERADLVFCIDRKNSRIRIGSFSKEARSLTCSFPL